MAKKRTKKQKQNAHHKFTLAWEPSSSKAKMNPGVKGQFENKADIHTSKLASIKDSINTAQIDEVQRTKKNIIKSLILAGTILGTEIVLYFLWK